jgi:hypothetical protein
MTLILVTFDLADMLTVILIIVWSKSSINQDFQQQVNPLGLGCNIYYGQNQGANS